MVGTDCSWGPEAGIIPGSDVPFSGPPLYSLRTPSALGQTLSTRMRTRYPLDLQLGKLREGKGLVHDHTEK